MEWLSEYRDLIEKVIRFGNAYALRYKKPFSITNEISLSAAEIQVIEYILENEERKESMCELAKRLGISASSFTKLSAKLTDMGLLEKYHLGNNKKNIIILASDYGKKVYEAYSEEAYRTWMSNVEELLSGIPKEYVEQFTVAMDALSKIGEKEKEEEPEALIPLS